MARGPKKRQQRYKKPTTQQRLRARSNQVAKRHGGRGAGNTRHKPDVRIDKAQIAWNARRYDEAIMHYEAALARDPINPVLLVDVARAYALRYRYEDAEKLVNRAAALHADDAQLQRMLGRSYRRLQHFDRSIACYRRSLELEPSSQDTAATLLELAEMHERLHELDTARACVEQALTLAPNWDRGRYLLAIINRRAGDYQCAKSQLTELAQTKDSSLGVIADCWYELAAIHDAAGDYDAAHEALTRAKQILSRAAAPYRRDAAEIQRTGKLTLLSLTAEHFQRWSAALEQLPPIAGGLALLTSHPRSGTTLLEQVLDSHPDLISADELQIMTELVYLPIARTGSADRDIPDVLDDVPLEMLQRARRDYTGAMEGALRESIGDRVLLDKNPALTGLLPLVGRVFPDMKILFALRDPRDVVISCFMQRLPLNPVSVQYLSLEGTAKAYAATMKAWLKLRGMIKNPWIEVRYEDTVANVDSQARKVLAFLDLPWDNRVLEFHERAQQKHVHSPTYEAVTKPIYTSSIGRWQNYAKQLEPCLEVLRPLVAEFGYA